VTAGAGGRGRGRRGDRGRGAAASTRGGCGRRLIARESSPSPLRTLEQVRRDPAGVATTFAVTRVVAPAAVLGRTGVIAATPGGGHVAATTPGGSRVGRGRGFALFLTGHGEAERLAPLA
jgi:hypothetical protein